MFKFWYEFIPKAVVGECKFKMESLLDLCKAYWIRIKRRFENEKISEYTKNMENRTD